MAPFFLALTTLLVAAQAVQVALPGGKYGIGMKQYTIPKTTHNEPTEAPSRTGTFVLVTVYYPTHSRATSPGPYFDPASIEIWETALNYPNGSLRQLETQLQPDAPFLSAKQSLPLPTIIFSPGGGVNAFMYYGLLADLASKGYTILALDHPYEPPALLLPNGTEIIGSSIYTSYNSSTSSQIEKYRISDMKAVISRFPSYVANVSAPFNTTAYISMGHSVGGAAASEVAASVDGMMGGVNLDGAFWAPFFPDVGKPFFIMTSINHTAQFDPSLTKFSGLQSAWWEIVSVYESAHLDYSDIGLWPQVLDLGMAGYLSTPEIGPIGGQRMLQIVRKYVTTFLDYVIDGSEGVLSRPSLKWREVVYVDGSDI